MTNLKLFVVANVLSIVMTGPMTYWTTGATQIESFDEQALSSVQKMSASDLDAKLAGSPFELWFNQIIGPKAGVVWQLTECGERIETGRDPLACAEINANLPDGRRVFVAISVGTFKKGMNGKPAFFGAAIEQNLQLYPVRRLSDLPEMLRAPRRLSDGLPDKQLATNTSDKQLATNTSDRIVNPPLIKADPAPVMAPIQDAYLLSLSLNASPAAGELSQPPPPPAPVPQLLPQKPEKVHVPEKLSESILQSRAITRVKPLYPPNAKKMNARGTVEVEITISEEGLVVEATAISGHFTLRGAAVEAARKWVFKPAIFNGAPASVKGILTFVFAPGAN
jgi:TonB family protein